MRMNGPIAVALVGVVFSACTSVDEPGVEGNATSTTSRAAEEPLIEVDGGASVVYTWIDEGGRFKVAQSRSEIPEDRREVVRVQDPGNPPSDTTKVWVADLRVAKGGRYAVRRMSRAELERLATSQRPVPDPAPDPTTDPATEDAGASQGSPRVVMYMTSTCPVCRRARSWLSKQGVSFVERNIQRDPNAARALQEKARQQGVPADGVPIFEIGGRLIPGFDQNALSKAIGG